MAVLWGRESPYAGVYDEEFAGQIEAGKECFYCYQPLGFPSLLWMGADANIFLHPECAREWMMKLMSDTHEALAGAPRHWIHVHTESDPLPPRDGMWLRTNQVAVTLCPNCEREIEDTLAVMAYRADLDYGQAQRRQNPYWALNGWRLWRECPHCEWRNDMEVADDAAVAEWGREYGGWSQHG
jgi:hypothetical protein